MIEALRDVSVSARTLQRDQVPEDVVGAVVFLCAPAPTSSPARRWSSTAASTSIDSRSRSPGRLARRAATASSTTSSGTTSGPRSRPRLHWELLDDERRGRAAVGAGRPRPGVEWLMRCDRVDFPPGRRRLPPHPPGPGHPLPAASARSGSRAAAETHEYGPFEPWFESGPGAGARRRRPPTEPTAFVRVLLLPREWAGKRTIRYVDPADEDKPKLQRATVFLEQPVARVSRTRRAGPRRPARRSTASTLAFCIPARATSPCSTRCTTRRSGSSSPATRPAPRTWPRRTASSPAGRGSASSRAARRDARAVGVYTAFQDSTPLILLVGQVPRAHRGREAFQELDYARMFGAMAKWVVEVEERRAAAGARRARVPRRALRAARAGRRSRCRRTCSPRRRTWPTRRRTRRARRARRGRPRAAARAARARPSGRSSSSAGAAGAPQAAADLQAWAEASRLPVAASFRCQDYVDNTSPGYAGRARRSAIDPTLAARVRDADLLVALGARLGEIATRGYTLLEPPRTPQTLVHVHADPDELGRVFEPDAADRRRTRRVRARCARARRRVDGSRAARLDASGARRLHAPASTARCPGDARPRRRDGAPARAAARRRDPHERRGQLHRVGAPLLRLPRATARSSRRVRARWATASRPRSPRRSSTPSGSSSASPATATS